VPDGSREGSLLEVQLPFRVRCCEWIMGNHDDRSTARPVKRVEQPKNHVCTRAIEITRWLVRKKKWRIGHDRTSNGNPLLLSTRKLARKVVCTINEGDSLERRHYAFRSFFFSHVVEKKR
jgi:hypothetical protein